MAQQEDNRPFRQKYRPYIYAAVFAWIMTLFIRPIVADGDAMAPAIENKQVIIVSNHKYTAKRGMPEYGEIIAFRKDFIEAGKEGENTVRRVVGLPGDKMAIKNGKVYRNGKVVKESYISKKAAGDDAPVKVGKQQVYVLGDNRGESIDSRDDRVGALDAELIRGKCSFIIWPLGDFGTVK